MILSFDFFPFQTGDRTNNEQPAYDGKLTIYDGPLSSSDTNIYDGQLSNPTYASIGGQGGQQGEYSELGAQDNPIYQSIEEVKNTQQQLQQQPQQEPPQPPQQQPQQRQTPQTATYYTFIQGTNL
jgi:hypothetical protein